MATQYFKTLPAGSARSHAHMMFPILDSNNVPIGASASGGDVLFSNVLAQSAVPVVLPSSGTIASGLLSALTALPTTYAGCWMYFPTGASLPSGAGLYWVVPSSTTAGQIYTAFQSAATAFTPFIPTSPVAITSGGSAYTQTTAADITLANINVPGGLMGANGVLRIEDEYSANNSAGAKLPKVFIAGNQEIQHGVSGNAITTNAYNRGVARLRNKGSQAINYAFSWTGFGANAVALYSTVDTSINQPLTFTGQLAVATDYIVLEGFTVEVLPMN